jgi:hypothetical protein
MSRPISGLLQIELTHPVRLIIRRLGDMDCPAAPATPGRRDEAQDAHRSPLDGCGDPAVRLVRQPRTASSSAPLSLADPQLYYRSRQRATQSCRWQACSTWTRSQAIGTILAGRALNFGAIGKFKSGRCQHQACSLRHGTGTTTRERRRHRNCREHGRVSHCTESPFDERCRSPTSAPEVNDDAPGASQVQRAREARVRSPSSTACRRRSGREEVAT